MASIKVRRTHRLWQELNQLPATSTGVGSISNLLSGLPQTSVFRLSPETRTALVALDNALDTPVSRAADAVSTSQEPNWVYWEKKLAGTVDVKALRERVLGLNVQGEDVKKEQQETEQLHQWYNSLVTKVTADERAELKEAFQVRLQELEADNAPADARAKLTRDFESQLQDLPKEIEGKLRTFAQIESIDFKAVPEAEGVPALPNKEELKEYYGIDFEVTDQEANKLKRWSQLLDKELNSARKFPNPLLHLKRNYEWDLAHATSEEEKKNITNAYNLKRRFLSQTDGAQSPQDLEPRMKDALTLQFIRRQQPGFKADTREELYEAVDQLGDRKEYDAFLEEVKHTEAFNNLETLREKNPTSAVNVWLSELERLSELIYDEWSLAQDFVSKQAAKWESQVKELEQRRNDMDTLSVNDIAKQHPEWEEEAKLRVQGQYWDVDVAPADVDRDRAKMEAKKKIWWEKDHH